MPSDPSSPEVLDGHVRDRLAELEAGPTGPTGAADGEASELLELFRSQCLSRHIDLLARRLRRDGVGYYTIGSSGHESNAALAMASRPTDPALLHYRSGAFYLARNRKAATATDPVDDVIAGMFAHRDEPIAGGRHKVFGHPETAIIPQTSTIASHLPRAVGVAMAIGRSSKLGVPLRWPDDAVVLCSFGDASANHSTALGAINAAAHLAFQRLPVPLVFVCEDNGWGISVRTPSGWIEASFSGRPGLSYVQVDGADAVATLDAATSVVSEARRSRRPILLHVRTVRYLGHAGTDVELGYRSPDEVRRSLAADPILGTARALAAAGVDGSALVEEYEACRDHVERVAARRRSSGRELATAAEVMTPIVSGPPMSPTIPPCEPIPRTAAADGRTLAQAINGALASQLDRRPEVLVFGEDVALKGGVYGVTKGLCRRFGAARVFDTVLDEQSVLGVALGAAVSGLVPIAEIEYLAYLHNAEDQIRGEAATLSFFSNGSYRNGMVVRIAGFGYQKGFGGHFHNDDSVAVLRDIPGIIVGSPARPADAAAMLAAMAATAAEHGSVGVMIEPIALYHQSDLHAAGDGIWSEPVAAEPAPMEVGSIRRYGDPDPDVTVLTWGNGLRMSLRVAARCASDGPRCQIIDLRWLAPLPIDAVLATDPRRILVVDETRRRGGVSEGILAELLDAGYTGPLARVTSKDSFVPLGRAADLVLLGEDEIESALRDLAG